MSVEFVAGREADLGKLRVGAALALVLAAAAGAMPASAQSAAAVEATAAPADAAPADVAPADEDQAASDAARERVYVFGKRVQSSVATVNAEDAPQIINIIDGETLAEQGVTSLEQALRNVPGITTQIGEGGVMSGDQFFIRGLSAKNDIFTDGLRDFGVFTRDSFNYGQVEVFKGPSASAFGRGAAGGGINTTSKTPYGESGGNATVSIGDAEYGRATADWNQALGDGVAVRIAAMVHHNENNNRDQVYSDRWGVAPSIGFGLDGDTSITVAYLHQDEEKLPDYGIPTTTATATVDATPISELGVDPKNYYGFAGDVDETVVDTITARLRHVVNDWVTVTSDTKYGYYQRYSQFTPTTCNAVCTTNLLDGNPATIPLGGVGGPAPYEQDTSGIQNITTAAINAPLGALKNELLVGVDASWQENDRNTFTYVSRDATKDLLNPQLGNNPVIGGVSNVRFTNAKDVSVFASDRLWFTDEWSVTVGLRQSYYEVDQTITNVAASTCSGVAVGAGFACRTGSNTEFFTPQVGVIFEPTPSQMWYVSYSSSAKPPGVSVANGDTIAGGATPGAVGTQDLEPEENTNFEIGGRMGLFGDRVQLQGAVFQTKKDNAKEEDAGGNVLLRSGDSQEITGLELGIAGAITDQWSMNANYTYLDTETTDCSPTAPALVCANTGNRIAFTPEHAASLWTTYNFTGGLAGLEVGGGLTYQDDVFLNVGNNAVAPGYTTLDGLISYGFDRFTISLNAYNLTDELYYAQVHGNRVTPGQGRTFIATLGVIY